MAQRNVKLVCVGDGAVGKTCLLLKYILNEYNESHIPTIFDNHAKRMTCDGRVICLTLWDTAGQEDYARLRPLSYPNTDVFVICFDLTSRVSLKNIQQKWFPELSQWQASHAAESDIVPKFILVGNKEDLWKESTASDKITDAEIDKFIQEADPEKIKGFKKCSAKTGEHVEDVFQFACKVALGLNTGKEKDEGGGACCKVQ